MFFAQDGKSPNRLDPSNVRWSSGEFGLKARKGKR